MRNLIITTVLALLLAASPAAMASSADSTAGTQSVGLVLSGGGAKGIAHIGVIQALEDNDIPIDYISGTSMGAIVGSLYACGFTPDQMMELINSSGFAHWSTGKIDRKLTYYFLQDEPLPSLVNLNLGDRDSTRWKSVLPSSLINPLPMNFAFMELYAPYTAQCHGNFNDLFVPFRCVSSDMTNKRMVVSSSGSLGDAVRASMSFPLVFHPIQRNGSLLYDGGIYDNFPVDVMRDNFAPQIMIGVDVSTTDTPDDNHSMMTQLETMIIQHSDYSLPADQGIKLRVHLEKFGLLDFDKADELYRIGYQKAMSMMDSIKSRIHSRIPAEARRLRRRVFKSQTPYLRFDSVSVSGGTRSQNAYLKSIFTHNGSDTFGLQRARDGFYRAITPGKFKNLEPTALYDDSTGLFSLNLKASLKNNLLAGIGGYLSTSTNSMLFLSGGYKTLSYNSLDMRINTWIGQSYLAAEAVGHIRLLRAVPSGLQIKAVVSRQKYQRRDKPFFQTSEPTFAITTEYFGRFAYDVAVGRRGKAALSLGYGHNENKYYLTDGFDRFWQNLAQIRAEYEYNTLNSVATPTGGAIYRVIVQGVTGNAYLKQWSADARQRDHRTFGQAEIRTRNYWGLSPNFALGAETDILMSTRKLLDTYSASIVDAPVFNPSPSYTHVFTPDFRANSFGAFGIVPVWRMSGMFELRGKADIFVPLRPILANPDGTARYGGWLSKVSFFGQVEGVVTLPFANISAYCHYAGVQNGRWNFGLSFGLFLQAPKFLR